MDFGHYYPLASTNQWMEMEMKMKMNITFKVYYLNFHQPSFFHPIRNMFSIVTQLHILQTQPNNKGIAATTTMMTGASSHAKKYFHSISSSHQDKTYNAIRIALGERILYDTHYIDTSWIVHSLSSTNAHSLRCDIFAEVIQWQVLDDSFATDFILSMNDFWSFTIKQWKNSRNLWWRLNDSYATQSEESPMKQKDENGVDTDADTDIDINVGRWMAIPSIEKNEFVRILPSTAAGVHV